MLKIIRQLLSRLASFFGMARAATSVESKETTASIKSSKSLCMVTDEFEAERLILNGADVNAPGTMGNDTPLHIAAIYKRRYYVAVVLIRHGANINAINKWGQTPLHRAVFKGFDRLVILLLERGADTSIRDYKGRTAWDVAKKRVSLKKEETYTLLRETTEKQNAVKTHD